jgi:hypothetical protein
MTHARYLRGVRGKAGVDTALDNERDLVLVVGVLRISGQFTNILEAWSDSAENNIDLVQCGPAGMLPQSGIHWP